MRPPIGRHGELLPSAGFSRLSSRSIPPGASAWTTHDGLVVLSACVDTQLPGAPEGTIGPQWLITVSRRVHGHWAGEVLVRSNRLALVDTRPSNDDVARVVRAFRLPAFEEDNHSPGISRALWCPLDPQYRLTCECKLTEEQITEADGYVWSNDPDDCRGCWYARTFGPACYRHGPAPVSALAPAMRELFR